MILPLRRTLPPLFEGKKLYQRTFSSFAVCKLLTSWHPLRFQSPAFAVSLHSCSPFPQWTVAFQSKYWICYSRKAEAERKTNWIISKTLLKFWIKHEKTHKNLQSSCSFLQNVHFRAFQSNTDQVQFEKFRTSLDMFGQF